MSKIKNLDIRAKLFINLLHLKVEEEKKYSHEECELDIVYVFNNYDEFKCYFIENGIDDEIDNKILDLCIMMTTRRGIIIAMKRLCDDLIRKYNKLTDKKKIFVKKPNN